MQKRRDLLLRLKETNAHVSIFKWFIQTTRSFRNFERQITSLVRLNYFYDEQRDRRWFLLSDVIRCIKHYSLPRISNAKFPRREITRKCRDRADTLHEIGSPRRAYHASGGAPFIFRRVSEAAPSSRCRRSPFSKQRGSCSTAIARIYLSLPLLTLPLAPSRPFSRRFSPVFLFLYFSHLRRPSPAALLALLALSRSCVSYVRTNSISRDSLRSGSAVNYFSSSRSRPAFFRTCASLSPPPTRSLAPRTPDRVSFFFVSLGRLPKRGVEKKAINKEKYARSYALRGSLDRFVWSIPSDLSLSHFLSW